MIIHRKDAISAINNINNKQIDTQHFSEKISELFAEDVFNLDTMKTVLSKNTFDKLLKTINNGVPVETSVANEVAAAMKEWAINKGATHFTHWFLPLNGLTAEKHESFYEPDENGHIISNFSGKNLIVGEPDASNFPSGGLRSTFEARGYTAWDPTSPAFIKRSTKGATLCIPSAFCSYTGHALDKKTPLLRSIQSLMKEVKRLLKCFNEDITVTTNVTLGAEQEYFLVDKHLFMCRSDLMHTGRTLFGEPAAKSQQFEDHYFGSIKNRVLSFMIDVEYALWRLGIPAKTRHNEAAPAQFELAPVYESMNLAVDHNMLTMELLRQIADQHDLVCLLHEKPFMGINGSGKHNNWSLMHGKTNLLDPGNNPHQNAIFLTILCAIIMAVDKHADLLRASVANTGNDYRLGASEAPPAIISIFLGDQLNDVIEQIEKGEATSSKKKTNMKIGVDALPPLPKDTTDRNRTSPFAFTGNKFEFRAPGSSQSCAGPNIVINTIVAEALDKIATKLEQCSREDFNSKLHEILQNIIKEHKRVIFNGDNYCNDWIKEAERRGLPIIYSSLEAFKVLIRRDNISLFEKYQVFTAEELHSRYEVFVEEYKNKIRIEGSIAANIANVQIAPTVMKYLVNISDSIDALGHSGLANAKKVQNKLLEKISELYVKMQQQIEALETAITNNETESIIKNMNELRVSVDALEKYVDDDLWPLPKYSELLYSIN